MKVYPNLSLSSFLQFDCQRTSTDCVNQRVVHGAFHMLRCFLSVNKSEEKKSLCIRLAFGSCIIVCLISDLKSPLIIDHSNSVNLV